MSVRKCIHRDNDAVKDFEKIVRLKYAMVTITLEFTMKIIMPRIYIMTDYEEVVFPSCLAFSDGLLVSTERRLSISFKIPSIEDVIAIFRESI